MITYKGLYLPDGEKHLQEWMDVAGTPRAGKPTYQIKKYNEALRVTKGRDVAIDIGAHAGLWSRVMALDFSRVVAFEPVPEHRACWRENLKDHPNAQLHAVALGDHAGSVDMHTRTQGSSGDTSVAMGDQEANAAAKVPLRRFDDYYIPGVSLIKVDNEGYEYFALRGAEETLKRCRPTVIVEQKPGMGQRFGLREQQAVEWLESIGMYRHVKMSGDFILYWRDR